MNFDARQIEQIVQAVLQRMQTPVVGAPTSDIESNGASSVLSPSGSIVSSVTTTDSVPGTLVVTDRVVTAELLRGRMTGVTCLQVSPKSVVTPLVRDMLRESGVRIERGSVVSSNTSLPAIRIALAVVDDPRSASQLVTVHRQPGVNWLVRSDWNELMRELVGSVSDQAFCGVIVTRRWAEITRKANRQEGLRAATVHSIETVDQAWQQIQPQLLVVNSTETTDKQLHSVLQRYGEYVSRHPNLLAASK